MIRFVCADRDRAAQFCAATVDAGWPATRFRADGGNMPYVVDVSADRVSASLMEVARAHRMVRTSVPDPSPLPVDRLAGRLAGAVRAATGR